MTRGNDKRVAIAVFVSGEDEGSKLVLRGAAHSDLSRLFNVLGGVIQSVYEINKSSPNTIKTLDETWMALRANSSVRWPFATSVEDLALFGSALSLSFKQSIVMTERGRKVFAAARQAVLYGRDSVPAAAAGAGAGAAAAAAAPHHSSTSSSAAASSSALSFSSAFISGAPAVSAGAFTAAAGAPAAAAGASAAAAAGAGASSSASASGMAAWPSSSVQIAIDEVAGLIQVLAHDEQAIRDAMEEASKHSRASSNTTRHHAAVAASSRVQTMLSPTLQRSEQLMARAKDLLQKARGKRGRLSLESELLAVIDDIRNSSFSLSNTAWEALLRALTAAVEVGIEENGKVRSLTAAPAAAYIVERSSRLAAALGPLFVCRAMMGCDFIPLRVKAPKFRRAHRSQPATSAGAAGGSSEEEEDDEEEDGVEEAREGEEGSSESAADEGAASRGTGAGAGGRPYVTSGSDGDSDMMVDGAAPLVGTATRSRAIVGPSVGLPSSSSSAVRLLSRPRFPASGSAAAAASPAASVFPQFPPRLSREHNTCATSTAIQLILCSPPLRGALSDLGTPGQVIVRLAARVSGLLHPDVVLPALAVTTAIRDLLSSLPSEGRTGAIKAVDPVMVPQSLDSVLRGIFSQTTSLSGPFSAMVQETVVVADAGAAGAGAGAGAEAVAPVIRTRPSNPLAGMMTLYLNSTTASRIISGRASGKPRPVCADPSLSFGGVVGGPPVAEAPIWECVWSPGSAPALPHGAVTLAEVRMVQQWTDVTEVHIDGAGSAATTRSRTSVLQTVSSSAFETPPACVMFALSRDESASSVGVVAPPVLCYSYRSRRMRYELRAIALREMQVGPASTAAHWLALIKAQSPHRAASWWRINDHLVQWYVRGDETVLCVPEYEALLNGAAFLYECRE